MILKEQQAGSISHWTVDTTAGNESKSFTPEFKLLSLQTCQYLSCDPIYPRSKVLYFSFLEVFLWYLKLFSGKMKAIVFFSILVSWLPVRIRFFQMASNRYVHS